MSCCGRRKSLRDRYGNWAFITGATSGICKAMALQLATKENINVVLVARGQAGLDQTANEIKAANPNVQVRTVSADLSSRDSVAQILAAVADIEIGILIPGAALEDHGFFVNADLEKQTKLIDMDCFVPMQLALRLGHLMSQRKRGGILFISSLSGWGGQPYMAHYGAAKAYILTLGEGMYHEMKGSGIDVTVLSPGPTKTPMIKDLPINFAKMGLAVMSPEDVASYGLRHLGCGAHAIPGFRNRVMANMTAKMMSRNMAGSVMRVMLGRQLKMPKNPYDQQSKVQ